MIAGRYELLRPLGRGAFGHTWLARDGAAGREVAVKVLDPKGAPDLKAYELFEREAAVLRSLRHHGIPEVHELVQGDWQGTPAAFLVMEYVEGTSLERVIDEQRQLAPADALHLLDELLGILEYLHGRVPPVLHRDIKPSNIIVRPSGLPALVDFGSVRRVLMAADESGSTVVGTYGYMPYEQYMGQATVTSDLYALAATFLHLATGRPPRDFMNDEGRIEVPEPFPGDPRLGAVIARMLRPSPAERLASAREVRRALLSAPAPSGGAPARALAARHAVPPELAAPTPRDPVDTYNLLERLAPSMRELMDGTSKHRWSAFDWLSLGFFSLVTVGTLPLVFLAMARARRGRLRTFLERGLPAAAEVVSIRLETTSFEAKIARVGYEFEVDGELHRDVDDVLPVVADRWRVGDVVQVLYIPEEDYDSVIVSTR